MNPALLALLASRAAAAGGASLDFVTMAFNMASANVYTFTDVPFGAEAADREIVVAVATSGASYNHILSVSIGGVAATIDVATADSAQQAPIAIARAAVPTGTTGAVVVTNKVGKTTSRCGIGVYRLAGKGAPVAVGAGAATTSVTGLGDAIAVLSYGSSDTPTRSIPAGWTADYDASPESGSWMTFAHGSGGGTFAINGTASAIYESAAATIY